MALFHKFIKTPKNIVNAYFKNSSILLKNMIKRCIIYIFIKPPIFVKKYGETS